MADRYQIRPSSPADVPALAALEVASFTDPWTAEQLRSTLVWPQVVAKVVESDQGEIVGHIIARVVVDQGEILSLATAPERRRSGVAALLLDTTLEEMSGRGVESVWLEVRDSNGPAQTLYHGRGFLTAGRRAAYYRDPIEDAIILRKKFRSPALPGTPVR